MKQIKGKQGLILCIGGLIIISIVFFYGVYEPQQQNIVNQKALQKEGQKKLILVKNFLNEHPNLVFYEKEVDEKEAIVEMMLPENMQISKFIRAMETFAQKHKIFLAAMKPDIIRQQDGIRSVAFAMEFYGDYFSLVAFLQEIERMQPFVCVKKLSIQAEEHRLNCKMVIETYAKMEIEKSNG
jgi:Tfp pilus assembly protein PilO